MLPELPAPTSRRIALRLHPRAERAVRRGHPWVFAEGISQQRQEGSAGDLAVMFDSDNRFMAIGLYDPGSPIRVRVLHSGAPVTIDGAWLASRIAAAHERRAGIEETDTTGFRVVHGENDGLPGLIIDRYGGSVVVKLYTAAWLPWLGAVLAAVDALLSPERVVLRLGRSVARAAAGPVPLRDGQVLRGEPLTGPVLFRENGLTFEADLVRGQKTGFFLDQRDNRARVERLAAGRSVLNVFSYTGGFSLYAARGGARSVTSLDLSVPALEAAQRNFAHNARHPAVAAAKHRVLAGDAFGLLPEIRDRGERFEVVIIDPPSFAKSQAEVERALGSYARIIRRGVEVLADGGLLVAASCSSRVTAEAFGHLVTEAVEKTGRSLRVLEQTGHAPDHPIGFAEGAYLKCVFGRIGARAGS
jgi:23S rRNA (cytosine1962-C5)-methyltransferase